MATSPQTYDHVAIANALENYYLSSAAVVGGGPFVHGTIFSKGRGFGSLIRTAIKAVTPFVKNIGRVVKPMAKKAGKYAVKAALETGTDIALDVIKGVDPEDAVSYNMERAKENTRYDAAQYIQSRKRRKLPAPKGKKVKRHQNFRR